MKHCIRNILISISISALTGCTAGTVQPSTESALQQQEQTIEEASAAGMKLKQTAGDVLVNDGTGDIETFAGMNLYDGYGVETEEESYSWIDLDDTKMLKMDEESRTVIHQNDSKLKITLEDGSMFFCVTKRLGDDESLEFESGNMTMSIRGTTGIIRKNNEDWITVILQEGEIEATYGDESVYMDGGYAYDFYLTEDGEYEVDEREISYGGDVCGFVQAELSSNEKVMEKYEDDVEYMTDEQNRISTERMIGTYQYQGTIYPRGSDENKDGESFVLNNPYIIEISLTEDGFYRVSFSETEEAYQEIESFNQRHATGGYFPEEHIGGEYSVKTLRFEDNDTVLFDFLPIEKLTLTDQGAVVTMDGEETEYTRVE